MEFNGKVAVITGASSGIGRATALAFAREGARVVIGDVNEEGSNETVRMIGEIGGEASFIRCDTSNPEDAKRMVAHAVEKFGAVDVAFNNSGIEGKAALVADYDIDMWNRVIGVNLSGVFFCMKFEIEQMLKQGKGAIVNNASILGHVGFPTASAYVAAKHGVLGLTKNAALEYGGLGIRVNAVCPGFVVTPMLERGGIMGNPEMLHTIENLHALKRLGTPDEIAEGVLWLCSDRASFVTGHPMVIDGGYLAR